MTTSTQIPMRAQVESYIRTLQNNIVSALEGLDPSAPKFRRDEWVRPNDGGSGLSCVFAVPPPSSSSSLSPTEEPTTVLEKAGVNISIVHGTLPPAAIAQMRADHSSLPSNPEKGLPFFAAGLSLVIHPRNPHCPTAHANYRYFEVVSGEGEEQKITWWFGGGADLTPSYLYDEDATHFHQTLKDACANEPLWKGMKAWCDEYFYLPHRQETRGVGGIFYDDLSDDLKHPRLSSYPTGANELFDLMQRLGNAFVPSYVPLIARRLSTPYTAEQRRWQLLRRGRYVEFNLVYDRGTKFGLMTPHARVESILMSLPEVARWEYMSEMGTEEASEEGRLVQVLKTPREWA